MEAPRFPQTTSAPWKILKTAQKYEMVSDRSSLCFMHGCGESLAAESWRSLVSWLWIVAVGQQSISMLWKRIKDVCGDKNGLSCKKQERRESSGAHLRSWV
jgi:hypothetical protein